MGIQDPIHASVQQLSDFLIHMIKGGKHLPDTLEGIKSCICVTLKLCSGVDHTHSPELTAIMQNFHKTCPRAQFEAPDWNLVLVLDALMKSPFEPLAKASLKHLTYKTVFLTCMSCAGRVGEIHALDYRKMKWDPDWSNVYLEPHSLFLAKTQKNHKATTARQFKIPNLTSYVGPHEPDRLLCPVRALRYYIARTKPFRQGKKALFVSLQPNRKSDITRQSINIWLRNTIRLAYALHDQSTDNLGRATNHEIRSVASSLVFEKSLSLSTVMKACHWRNNTTFTSFYLKDVAVMSHDLMRLSPVVVAASVLHQVHIFTIFMGLFLFSSNSLF